MKEAFAPPYSPSLTKLIEDIVKETAPEKIYLLSTCFRRQYSETIFTPAPVEFEQQDRFDLLVLAGEDEKRSNEALQHIIESRCGMAGHTTAFVLPIQQFNTWLMHTQPFACRVYRNAELCYDAGNIPLAIPDHVSVECEQEELEKQFKRYFQRATEFMKGAELFTLRKQFALSAFHLHQAAEQLYTGIVLLFTGLRVHTHNLDKLYRYSRNLFAGLTAVFPCNSEKERQLFKLLQKAYIESRYGNEYRIKEEEVDQLHQRIIKLTALCEPLNHTIPTTF